LFAILDFKTLQACNIRAGSSLHLTRKIVPSAKHPPLLQQSIEELADAAE
jgi:hypothetical protein